MNFLKLPVFKDISSMSEQQARARESTVKSEREREPACASGPHHTACERSAQSHALCLVCLD